MIQVVLYGPTCIDTTDEVTLLEAHADEVIWPERIHLSVDEDAPEAVTFVLKHYDWNFTKTLKKESIHLWPYYGDALRDSKLTIQSSHAGVLSVSIYGMRTPIVDKE